MALIRRSAQLYQYEIRFKLCELSCGTDRAINFLCNESTPFLHYTAERFSAFLSYLDEPLYLAGTADVRGEGVMTRLGFGSFRVFVWRLFSMMSRRWPGLNRKWAIAGARLTKVFTNPYHVTRGTMIRRRPRLRVVANRKWASAGIANRADANATHTRSANG